MSDFVDRFLAYCLSGTVVGCSAWFTAALLKEPFQAAVAFAIAVIGIIGAILLLARTGGTVDPQKETQSRSATWASDIVCLIAAALAGFFVVDGLTERLDLLPSMIDEPLAADVVAFMFLPSAAILAGFVTQNASQMVSIDAKGVQISRFGETVFIAWREVRDLKLDSQYVVVSRVGMLIPRKLRTNLIIETETDDQITIIDPASKSGRRRLLARMKQFAPAHLSKLLSTIDANWR